MKAYVTIYENTDSWPCDGNCDGAIWFMDDNLKIKQNCVSPSSCKHPKMPMSCMILKQLYRVFCTWRPQRLGPHLPHETCIQTKRICGPLPRETISEVRLLALGYFLNDQTLWQVIVDVEDRFVTLIAAEMKKEIKLVKWHCFHEAFLQTTQYSVYCKATDNIDANIKFQHFCSDSLYFRLSV